MNKDLNKIKIGLAEMLKGGVIMDVTTPEQAKIAEDAGAVAVMALERIPAEIRKDGGIARMSNPEVIKSIQKKVSIPVMAKCRIGHFAEAQILEALEENELDENQVHELLLDTLDVTWETKYQTRQRLLWLENADAIDKNDKIYRLRVKE